jgi:hypothetical protein
MARETVLCLGLVIGCATASAYAQIFTTPPRSSAAVGVNNAAAPIPDPILKGKKAFISYELGDVSSFPSRYSGGPERAYSEFLAGMKAWGRYEIVTDPKQADVIFAIRFVDPPEIPKPQIRVGVMDPVTHAALWGFVEEIDFAFRKKSRDADFSDTVHLLVTDVQQLVEPTPTSTK